MSLNFIKKTLAAVAIFGAVATLTSCTLGSQNILGLSLVDRGKFIGEIVEERGAPDDILLCNDNGEQRVVYAFVERWMTQRSVYRGQGVNNLGGITTYYSLEDVPQSKTFFYFTDENDKVTSVHSYPLFYRSSDPNDAFQKSHSCGKYNKPTAVKAKTEDLSKLQAKPRLWRTLVGSPEINMVWASDKNYPDATAAEQDAMKQCVAEGGKSCNVIMSISNMCMAFGGGIKNGKPIDYVGSSLDARHAKAMVVENCQADGAESCRATPNVEAVCALPCKIGSDSSCYFDQSQVIVPTQNGGKPMFVAVDGLRKTP